MGRPGLDLGTAGAMRLYPTADGYRAMTRYRDWDGRVRQVERRGTTKGAARRALTLAVRDWASGGSGADLTPDTTVARLAEVWLADIQGRDLSPSTVQAYQDRAAKQVIPALGDVKLRELTVGIVDRHLRAVRTKHGSALAKTTRSVLSSMCQFACRHDAMSTNPCRDVSSISSKPQKPPTSLSIDELRRLHQSLQTDQHSLDRDLPDLVLLLMATGLRIGEALALRWTDVDLAAQTIDVKGTVLRLRGGGLIIKTSTKSAAGQRVLELPAWAVTMLQQRNEAAALISATEVLSAQVFPAPVAGGVRDPSNTLKMLRQAFKAAGFEGVTTHQFRKTVATLMDEAGLSARSAADQLGHAKPSLTSDLYMGRKKRATGAAGVLEGVFEG